MQGKQQNQARILQVINLEALVPPNHFLRRLDQVLDVSFIRERTRHLYVEGRGRHSIPPELVLRAFLLQYLYDLSDRELCSEITMHAGFRWFCRLNFDDPVPDRSTLVKLRRLWSKVGIFAEVMNQVVRVCVEAGLVSGKALAIDGTQVEANAAITSLERITPAVCLGEWVQRKEADDRQQEAQEGDAGDGPAGGQGMNGESKTSAATPQRKAGDPNFRGERFANDTHRSRTDREARLYRKGSGQGAKLSYIVNNALDPNSGVIISTRATLATGSAERKAALHMVDEALPLLPATGQALHALMDKGYIAGWLLAALMERRVIPVVSMPNTALEPIPTWQRRTFSIEQQRNRQQKVREAEARNAVRRRQGAQTHRRLRRARIRVEHSFAEAKELHGLGRARGRGLLAMQTQALLTATVQNLKRLANWRRRAAPQTTVSPLVSIPTGFFSPWNRLRCWIRLAILRLVPQVRPCFSPHF